MKNPTTIEEIINWPKEYRVIADGREMQCRSIFFDDTTISLYTGDPNEYDKYQWYSPSQVQELTPLYYGDKRIAIGDLVKIDDDDDCDWFIVTSYSYYSSLSNGWFITGHATIIENKVQSLLSMQANAQAIKGHKTTNHDPEAEKAIKLLTDKGIIQGDKIIL